MQDIHDLSIMIKSKIPIIVIETHEEARVIDILRHLAIPLSRPVYSWAITEGIKRVDHAHEIQERLTEDPEAALGNIKSEGKSGIYALCDFHPYVNDAPKVVRLIKEIAMAHQVLGHTLVMISHAMNIPPEVRHFSARFQLALPNDNQLMTIVRKEAVRWSKANGNQKVKTDSKALDKLVNNLKGLPFHDVHRLARGAIADDGCISVDDIPEVNKAKFELMNMEGVLSFEYDTASFANVGGLKNLKVWLKQRKQAFLKGVVGMDRPKGMMLVGVQGGGKSLAAKAVAGAWGLSLLRLDFGALYNKYIGETEKNLRNALQLAQTMAPCVLWVDEIEKGLSTSDSDDGTSKRLLGTLLTWMAERDEPVFMVATSNDISKLPPELIRKGRLDEVFFVDLPEADVRQAIFSIHLSGRGQDVAQFDLARLADATSGFTGAEIEQVVVSGLYGAEANNAGLDTNTLLHGAANTSPLSVVMAEQVDSLRRWAQQRAVFAN